MATPDDTGLGKVSGPSFGPALRRSLAWAGITVVLILVFMAYLQPDMAFQMAQQLWSCF